MRDVVGWWFEKLSQLMPWPVDVVCSHVADVLWFSNTAADLAHVWKMGVMTNFGTGVKTPEERCEIAKCHQEYQHGTSGE